MTNYVIEINDDFARGETRINAYEVLGTYTNTCDKIVEGWAKPFASIALSQDEYDWFFEEGENPNQLLMSQDFYDKFDFVPFSEVPRVEEFFGSLDHYAKQDKQSWSCEKCGATTTDPSQRLIKWFHDGCKG